MGDVVIPPFNPAKIPPARTLLLVGKRNTGKTTLLTALCYFRRKMTFGIAVVGSIGSRLAIQKFHPDTYIYEGYNEQELAEFWANVKRMNGRRRRNNQQMYDCYLLLDDTGFDDRMWRSPTLKEMMMNGRQYHLTLIMCMQYMKGLQPSMRAQVDYLLILAEKSPEMLDRLWTCFTGGIFPDKPTFRKVLNKCTQNYKCLVIKNVDIKHKKNEVFDGAVEYYRAPKNMPRFRIGCRSMWVRHFQKYNEHYESEEEESGGTAFTASSTRKGKTNEVNVYCEKPKNKKTRGKRRRQ